MARRTVSEPALSEMASDLKQFSIILQHRLDEAADELHGLHHTWGGVAYAAFAQRLDEWRKWAEELGAQADRMQRNAHIAHPNYTHNNEVNLAMWSGN